MGWLRWVGCLKIQVSLQNTGLFCRALLQQRPIFLSILLIVATPYMEWYCYIIYTYTYTYIVGLRGMLNGGGAILSVRTLRGGVRQLKELLKKLAPKDVLKTSKDADGGICTPLQCCSAVCCSAVCCSAVCCSAVCCSAVCCSAVCCSESRSQGCAHNAYGCWCRGMCTPLQCVVAACCSVSHCSMLQWKSPPRMRSRLWGCWLKYMHTVAAFCCSVLQHVTVFCSKNDSQGWSQDSHAPSDGHMHVTASCCTWAYGCHIVWHIHMDVI